MLSHHLPQFSYNTFFSFFCVQCCCNSKPSSSSAWTSPPTPYNTLYPIELSHFYNYFHKKMSAILRSILNYYICPCLLLISEKKTHQTKCTTLLQIETYCNLFWAKRGAVRASYASYTIISIALFVSYYPGELKNTVSCLFCGKKCWIPEALKGEPRSSRYQRSEQLPLFVKKKKRMELYMCSIY